MPASGAQSPELNTVASESESLISKESEPPKKKKKRLKQKSSAEQEGRGTATPTLGMNPVELAVSGMLVCCICYNVVSLYPLKQFVLIPRYKMNATEG